MQVQPDLFPPTDADQDKATLRAHLSTNGWQTRRQIAAALGWPERKIRDVAESMGTDIVRGQAGFKLTDQIHRDSPDVPLALQACDAFESQGKKNLAYALGLRHRLHIFLG